MAFGDPDAPGNGGSRSRGGGDPGAPAGGAGGRGTGEWGGGRAGTGGGSAPGSGPGGGDGGSRARGQRGLAGTVASARNAMLGVLGGLTGRALPGTRFGALTDDEIEHIGMAFAQTDKEAKTYARAMADTERERTKTGAKIARAALPGPLSLFGVVIDKAADARHASRQTQIDEDPWGAINEMAEPWGPDTAGSEGPDTLPGAAGPEQPAGEGMTGPTPTATTTPGRQVVGGDTLGFTEPMPIGPDWTPTGRTTPGGMATAARRQVQADTPALAYMARVNQDILRSRRVGGMQAGRL